MKVVTLITKLTNWPRPNRSEPTKKLLKIEEPSDIARLELERLLSILDTETNAEKLKETKERFVGICTEEQMQGHNIKPYWDRYEAYKNRLKTYQ